MVNGSKYRCECGNQKVAGKCPLCEPLRKPRIKAMQAEVKARKQAPKVHGYLSIHEARRGIAKAKVKY